ncbi:MAG TPA: methyltransferase [Rhizomicrobium sp.]|nr:methyltransferase [Rhizomicrobium sp.]
MSETFLDGRVKVTQPETGFRSGLDAVMLAAAVPALTGQAALELGAGSGAASLCLAARVSGVTITGVERDEGLAALARGNAAANGADCRFVAADVFALPPELKRDFDQVFANPPFHGEGQVSPDTVRAAALMDDGKLRDWMKLGLQRTVSGGFFTAILRADRLNQALAALPERGLCAFPLWPRQGEAAKRVIIQVRKGSNAPFALLPGLVLHRDDGAWTPQAEAVLRRGGALALSEARL